MIDDARSQRFAHHTELESYRSGHNEAVLKTVCPQGRVGSNPTLSALKTCIGGKADTGLFLRRERVWNSLCYNRSEKR